MSIAFDAHTNTVVNPASNTITHTSSGSDRYVIVGGIIQSNRTVTSITYGGVPMVEIEFFNTNNVSLNESIFLYGLADPPTGSQNIVGTFSGAGIKSLSATSFTGAQQTSAITIVNTQKAASGASVCSVTTDVDNSWLVGMCRGQTNTTASAGTVKRGAAASNINLMDSNSPKSPTGSYSLGFTTATNQNFASIVAALAPAGGPPPAAAQTARRGVVMMM